MPKIAVFLAAADGTLLTKRFIKKKYPGAEEAALTTIPYPHVRNMTSHEVEFETIEDFYEEFVYHANQGHALLGGQLTAPITDESRAGKTDVTKPMHLLLIDVDGLNVPKDVFLTSIGLHNVSRIEQFSASSGMPGKDGLHAHFVFILQTPVTEEVLSRWMESINYHIPVLAAGLTLTAGKHTLHYPLDKTLAQASRLTFIASPQFEGIDDPHPNDRIQFVKGELSEAPLNMTMLASAPKLRTERTEHVNRLRVAENLPPLDHRLTKRKGYDGERYDVMVEPGPMTLEVSNRARGFVYLNLNGGDSNAYYHPEDNAELIYNFKGEPVLPTEKVNKTYYDRAKNEAKKVARQRQEDERLAEVEVQLDAARNMFDPLKDADAPRKAPVHFYCIDDRTGQYKVGTYDPNERTLDLRTRGSPSQVGFFARQFGLPDPEQILSCRVEFDPTELEIYRPPQPGEIGWLNLYCPSPYRIHVEGRDDSRKPPTIDQLVTHVLGGDTAFVDHWYNWLAFIFQEGDKTQTGWIHSGTTGTGKDTLFQRVVREIVGPQQFMSKRLDQLEDKFDGELGHTQLMVVNEATMEKLQNAIKVMAKLKENITNNYVGVRGLFEAHRTIRSFLNIVVLTNSFNAMPMEMNDRRWNVTPRQEKALKDVMVVGPELHRKLDTELQMFANFLAAYEVREHDVRMPKDSQAKRDLQTATVTTPELLVAILREGKFEELINILPTDYGPGEGQLFRNDLSDPKNADLMKYIKVLDKIAACIRRGEATLMFRDDFKAIFAYWLGHPWSTQSAAKFTRAIKKYSNWDFNASTGHRMRLDNNKTSAPCYYIPFQASQEQLAFYVRHYSYDKGLCKV